MPLAPIRTSFRAAVRRALLVSVLAAAALAAAHGSAGAQPGPDDDPNYNDPMWRVANPAAETRTAHPPAETEVIATDNANASSQAALPANDGDSFDPSDPNWWIADEQSAGGR